MNLLLINNTSLVVSSIEMQRTLIQTKVYYKFFYFLRTETTQKILKEAAAKNVFIHCAYYIDTVCFDEFFLFHVITRRHYKSLSLVWHFLNGRIAFFKTSVLEEICILLYLHKISAVLIPKFPKLSINLNFP